MLAAVGAIWNSAANHAAASAHLLRYDLQRHIQTGIVPGFPAAVKKWLMMTLRAGVFTNQAYCDQNEPACKRCCAGEGIAYGGMPAVCVNVARAPTGFHTVVEPAREWALL